MFLCFAEPTNAYGTLLNKVTAFITGGSYCHCAVVFELPQIDGSVKYVECSIVRCKDERFNKVHLSEVESFEGWSCWRLQLQRAEYEIEAYNYVVNNLLGQPYDNLGSIMDFTFCWCCPIGYRNINKKEGETEKTYCSRLAMDILHKVGQFLDHEPNKITPNGIFKLIQKSKDKTACWTDVSAHATAIFSKTFAFPPVSYVYSASPNYSGLLLF